MLNKTPNKQIYRMLSLLLNCLKVHVFVCLPLFNHRFCSIKILFLSKSETKTTTESFLVCSYSSSSIIFLFVSNSQLIQFIINVIESMYYVIKLEIGTTKRIDRQHKRYVSFPILTHTKLKAIQNKPQKKSTNNSIAFKIVHPNLFCLTIKSLPHSPISRRMFIIIRATQSRVFIHCYFQS